MSGRPSLPEEEPPRGRGRVGSWLVGGVAGAVGVALLLLAAIVVLVVAL